ncbi:MAG: hypothetical protein LAP39_23190 [Acidobacteriia bacterium]|nr:hypothetical protein [Terriglobia bacterium]
MRILFSLFLTGWLACAGPAFSQVPDPLYGLTIDNTKDLQDIVASVGGLRRKPTTRIVFDEKVPASQYVDAVIQLKKVSYIMGEILDSFPMRKYSVSDYIGRTHDYLDMLGDKVDIWEIGNEINGDWLGNTSDVVAKMTGTYDIIKNAGKTTELTLYYNQGCAKKPSNEMFTWVQANIPSRMMTGLDYVLVSYYEDDCKGLQPDWPTIYQRLAVMFPNSKLGFGECGTKYKARKEQYVKRYYGLKIDAPRYVGGYFWWYYKQDMVPKTKPLWDVINTAMSGY